MLSSAAGSRADAAADFCNHPPIRAVLQRLYPEMFDTVLCDRSIMPSHACACSRACNGFAGNSFFILGSSKSLLFANGREKIDDMLARGTVVCEKCLFDSATGLGLHPCAAPAKYAHLPHEPRAPAWLVALSEEQPLHPFYPRQTMHVRLVSGMRLTLSPSPSPCPSQSTSEECTEPPPRPVSGAFAVSSSTTFVVADTPPPCEQRHKRSVGVSATPLPPAKRKRSNSASPHPRPKPGPRCSSWSQSQTPPRVTIVTQAGGSCTPRHVVPFHS